MPSDLYALTTDQSGAWKEVLDRIGVYDFHHLPSYHRLAEMRGEGEARLLMFREGEHVAAFPVLVRQVGQVGRVRPDAWDVTSTHGYLGPLASPNMPEDTRQRFLEELDAYFRSHAMVTAFTRLHPLIDQSPILQGYGEIMDIGWTVSIDLTPPPEEQVARYRKSNRYEIQRLEKIGFTCAEAGIERLDDFLRIYLETMRNLNADPYYFYDRAYFEYLLCDMSEIMHLFICDDGDTPACVGLFSDCNGIIQYHLAGTGSEYRRLAPMKLMLDTVRKWGISKGATTFHLGGGVGAQRDSLFEFKKGFGSREHGFHGWKHVVDQELYDALCAEACRYAQPDDSYFPMYRHPALKEVGLGKTNELSAPDRLPNAA